MSKFVFGDSKVAKTSQEIRDHESQSIEATKDAVVEPKENEATEPAVAESPAPLAQEPTYTNTPTNKFELQGKKTANGIVVNVPMDDYMQLTMMKFQTGRTLKDLALQAIHEFVERNSRT